MASCPMIPHAGQHKRARVLHSVALQQEFCVIMILHPWFDLEECVNGAQHIGRSAYDVAHRNLPTTYQGQRWLCG